MDVVNALYMFYHDSDSSPEKKLAIVCEIKSEVCRLEKYIQSMMTTLTRDAEQRNEAERAGAGETPNSLRTED